MITNSTIFLEAVSKYIDLDGKLHLMMSIKPDNSTVLELHSKKYKTVVTKNVHVDLYKDADYVSWTAKSLLTDYILARHYKEN